MLHKHPVMTKWRISIVPFRVWIYPQCAKFMSYNSGFLRCYEACHLLVIPNYTRFIFKACNILDPVNISIIMLTMATWDRTLLIGSICLSYNGALKSSFYNLSGSYFTWTTIMLKSYNKCLLFNSILVFDFIFFPKVL